MYIYTNIHIHTIYIHTYTHKYTHTYIQIYIYIKKIEIKKSAIAKNKIKNTTVAIQKFKGENNH